MKEASIDCALHAKPGDKDQLRCFSFGSVNSSKFAYQPSYAQEDEDTEAERNKTEITWEAVEFEIEGVKYALNQLTGEVYNLASYHQGNPVQVGKLIIEGKGKNQQYIYEPI